MKSRPSQQGQADFLVREYEPEIRRIVRHRLRDRELRRVIDSLDICQSVFGRFFVCASLGQFQLRQPEDLVKLLTRMAINRVIDKHRSEKSQRQLISMRSSEYLAGEAGERIDPSDNADKLVEYEDLIQQVRTHMSRDELAISRLRTAGTSWLDISLEMNESPHALRKRLERGCERVFSELGIFDNGEATSRRRSSR